MVCGRGGGRVGSSPRQVGHDCRSSIDHNLQVANAFSPRGGEGGGAASPRCGWRPHRWNGGTSRPGTSGSPPLAPASKPTAEGCFCCLPCPCIGRVRCAAVQPRRAPTLANSVAERARADWSAFHSFGQAGCRTQPPSHSSILQTLQSVLVSARLCPTATLVDGVVVHF